MEQCHRFPLTMYDSHWLHVWMMIGIVGLKQWYSTIMVLYMARRNYTITRNPQRHLVELVVVRQTHRQKHLTTLEHVRNDSAVVVLPLYRLVRDEGDGLRRTAGRAPDAVPTHVVRHVNVLARRHLQLQRHRLHQKVVLIRQKTPTFLTLVLEFHHKKAVSVHLLDETPASAAR